MRWVIEVAKIAGSSSPELAPIPGLTLGVLTGALSSEALGPTRPYRIGILSGAWAPNHPTVEGLKAGLKRQGFEEGRDVAFEIRFTEGNPDAAPSLAAGLVQAGVDLLFTTTEPNTKAARALTESIPIVFTAVGDPVASRIVADLGRPGGNVTGVSSLDTQLVPKRIEILKAMVPTLRRVWITYPADDPLFLAAVRSARKAVEVLRLELQACPVRTPEDVAGAFKALRPGDGLLAPTPATLNIPGQVLETSLAARVPAIFPSAFWVSYGALISYGSDYHAEGVQAARLVAKILRGARPQYMPVEGADRIELALNLKTAKSLGLTIPRRILLRAEKLIE